VECFAIKDGTCVAAPNKTSIYNLREFDPARLFPPLRNYKRVPPTMRILCMASIIPGWNSIEGATRWHRGFEIVGFVALGLLLLFEVLAYIYGNRKDTLIFDASTRTEQERQDENAAADRARDDKIQEAQNRASQATESQALAEKEIERLRDAQRPREITGPKLQEMIAALQQHKGTLVAVRCVADPEAAALGNQILNALVSGGWNIGSFVQSEFGLTARGLIYAIPDPSHPTVEQRTLISALKQAGISPTVTIGRNEILVGIRIPQ
jgi:hypothetical protein